MIGAVEKVLFHFCARAEWKTSFNDTALVYNCINFESQIALDRLIPPLTEGIAHKLFKTSSIYNTQ